MPADKTPNAPGTGDQSGTGATAKAAVSAATRARILTAAAEIAKEKGAAHLSLEAIARRAGVSKGGLLYHFPRKDALIHALVEQHVADIDAALAEVEADKRRRGNAVARAFVELNRDKMCQPTAMTEGILVALAENPHLFDPVRDHEVRIVERVRRTATDRELSLIALLVIQGMRLLDLFSANHMTLDERAAVLDRLLALLDREDDRPA